MRAIFECPQSICTLEEARKEARRIREEAIQDAERLKEEATISRELAIKARVKAISRFRRGFSSKERSSREKEGLIMISGDLVVVGVVLALGLNIWARSVLLETFQARQEALDFLERAGRMHEKSLRLLESAERMHKKSTDYLERTKMVNEDAERILVEAEEADLRVRERYPKYKGQRMRVLQ